jgi:aryl-alcohol dehydrogenase-like predicted oxidoreductase
MRLSTSRDRDDEVGIAVLHAALDAGVDFLDTADAYCWDEHDTGHNERLIARALATWRGDRSRVVVATKGGLTRPGGEWIPDGRAKHVHEACEASLRALGVERIDLYQLHAPDPRVPFATTARALASLQRDGLVESIGLCNVSVAQIEEASQIVELASVQVELGPWHDDNILNGVAEYCLARGITLLAHRPLGGPGRARQLAADRTLAEIAARHEASPAEIALAWLGGASPHVLPRPGPTRIETARSAARARTIVLSSDERALLDRELPAGRAFRFRQAARERRTPQRSEGEVVLIMGLPGAGKSTLAAAYVDRGYVRLNRDDSGGALKALLPALASAVTAGSTRIVADNTYISRTSRAAVVQTAWQHELPVRCVWLATSVEDAQVNAVTRIVTRYGRLLMPEEMKTARKHDIAAFPPTVLFRYQRELEPPHADEGFSAIEVARFERRRDPSFVNRAVIVSCDGGLLGTDAQTVRARREVLRRYAGDGWRLLGIAWRPEVAGKTMTPAEVEATFARMQDELGVPIEIEYCPHGAGAPICWCRKPLPGLGVLFTLRHHLDPAQCIYVGAGPQDPVFARRLQFQYREAAEFFRPDSG